MMQPIAEQSGVSAPGDDYEIRPISRQDPDCTAALRLALCSSHASPSDEPVKDLLSHVDDHSLKMDLLFGAYRGDRLTSACVAPEPPGNAALVFFPSAPPQVAVQTLGALLRHIRTGAWNKGIALLQALIEPKQQAAAQALRHGGFRYLTRLEYLTRVDFSQPHGVRGAADLEWLSYSPQTATIFCDILHRTYAQSLDCPELTGIRAVTDVLAGHRATGEHDPAIWQVALRAGQPVGVLLLSWISHRQGMELVYMGVAQGSRGQGVAHALLARSGEIAVKKGARFMALAVDERNSPALSLYSRWNFTGSISRSAWIATPDQI